MAGFDAELAARIDHTLLRPDAQPPEMQRLCDEARRYRFAAVCVQPTFVATAARLVAGSPVRVVSVIAFPHGASVTAIKTAEAERALADGASEIDMVANLTWLAGSDWSRVRDEVSAVVRVAGPAAVKVIIETGMLDEERIRAAALVVRDAGAAFVKTSTGFGLRGASVTDVALLRSAVGDSLGIKASGGIRTREMALALVEAGADRLGCSSSVAVITLP